MPFYPLLYPLLYALLCLLGCPHSLVASQMDATPLANEQDEIAADLEELLEEQTDAKIRKPLLMTQKLMDEAYTLLEQGKINGQTIAVETEIIEKIVEAAQKKQQGKSSSMMQLLQLMTGQKQAGNKPSSSSPGLSSLSSSSSLSSNRPSQSKGKQAALPPRTVPRNAGLMEGSIPQEFSHAFEAFNRAVKQKLKNK